MAHPPRDPEQPEDPSQPNTGRDETIARLEQALAEALARNAQSEAVLADQRARLKTLGNGREEGMRALVEAREQLRMASIEREELRKQLARVDGMQTATITLPDEPTSQERQPPAALPSIEDLMATLGEMKEPGAKASAGHLHMRAEAHADASAEMLAPEIVFPEQFAATKQNAGSTGERINRVLVLLDGEQPIKFPLYKDEMIVGRAESADIQIDSHFISRLHARLLQTEAGVTIEDFESKNGIKINSKLTNKQTLRHGDLLSLGGLRFRFLDAAADAASDDAG
jgi:FHA domain